MREWERPFTGGETDVDPPTRGPPFILQRMCLVILTNQSFGEHVAVIFPGVVSLGISPPFDQILECSPSPKSSMISNGLDFILLLSVDDVWGWSREVGSILGRLMVRREKAGVENVMDRP